MHSFDAALEWCRGELGPCQLVSRHGKTHGGHESSVARLRLDGAYAYLKLHYSLEHWENELHAYRQWAGAFGQRAPRLLAAAQLPAGGALALSELPGQVVEGLDLPHAQGLSLWRAAGAALRALHQLPADSGAAFFGRCRADGAPAEDLPGEAQAYLAQRFGGLIERARRAGCLDAAELATVQAALALVPAFEGQAPRPCHRDYCAANWLADEAGTWTGVIDFEFARWDLPAADFCRDPSWTWLRQPERMQAFFEGYGLALGPREQAQLRLLRSEYALDAIVWGRENAFYGFEREGRTALAYLGQQAY